MGDGRIKVAILGSGNMGTDLMYKVKRSSVLDLEMVVWIDPKSDGLSLARDEGFSTSVEGINGILGNPEIKIVFDATEVLVAVLHKLGYETGIDLYKIMDNAEKLVKPMMRRPQEIDNAALTLGYVGVYFSFLLHAYRAAERFGIDARNILIELVRRKVVGGQEDLIIDMAYELAKKRGKN